MMQQQLEDLREIRDLVQIPDISFYFFIGAILIALLFTGALLYMFYQRFRQKRRTDLRKKVLERLRNVDFSDPKKAAYQITKYGHFLATEERSRKLFAQLLPRLEKYKFTPNPPPVFDSEDIKYYDLFVESVDE
jgi:hypothetical protein